MSEAKTQNRRKKKEKKKKEKQLTSLRSCSYQMELGFEFLGEMVTI